MRCNEQQNSELNTHETVRQRHDDVACDTGGCVASVLPELGHFSATRHAISTPKKKFGMRIEYGT